MIRLRSLVVAMVAAIALIAIPASKADAYLHVDQAQQTCWNAVYPSAQANLAPWGGSNNYNWIYIRSTDTSVQIQIEAFGRVNAYYAGQYLTDRLVCRIQGNDPGVATAIADWGTGWRLPSQFFN